MSDIREEAINNAIHKATALLHSSVCHDLTKRYEFIKQTILADKSLTNSEETRAIQELNRSFDIHKIILNEGPKRMCEVCQEQCLATSYCEHCIRNYLEANFSNWTSGNDDIDNLIQKCQLESSSPRRIIEWIPYNNLQDIEYITKGGFSEIYSANWINGGYDNWDANQQQLERDETEEVILKKLENVEIANRNWFEEVPKFI
jgi:hypothetical protein